MIPFAGVSLSLELSWREFTKSGIWLVLPSYLAIAVMVPITVGFLASLAGLFVIVDSAQADRRLSLLACPIQVFVRLLPAGIAIRPLGSTRWTRSGLPRRRL